MLLSVSLFPNISPEDDCIDSQEFRNELMNPIISTSEMLEEGGRGAMSTPVFDRSVNSNSTTGADYVHYINTAPPHTDF